MLYYLGNDGIQALRPTDGVQLWADTTISRSHWESPIVAAGRLYVTDENGHLAAYALSPSSTPAVRLAVRPSGKRLSWRWTVASAKGISGFALYAGQTQLRGGYVAVHKSKTYTRRLQLPAGTSPAGFSLRVLLKDGRRFTVFPQ